MSDDDIIYQVGKDGSITARRPFMEAIALMRLQFSSSKGTAFCISSQRTPQIVIYEET